MNDLADVVGELAAQFPQAHLQAWIRILRETSEPGKTVATQLIEAKPGYALAPKAMRLMEAWRTASPVPDGPALAIITELIRDCRKSLLVVSFAAFGVADVVSELKLAANSGVTIDLVLESTTTSGGTLHGTVEASAVFNAIRQDAKFWV